MRQEAFSSTTNSSSSLIVSIWSESVLLGMMYMRCLLFIATPTLLRNCLMYSLKMPEEMLLEGYSTIVCFSFRKMSLN